MTARVSIKSMNCSINSMHLSLKSIILGSLWAYCGLLLGLFWANLVNSGHLVGDTGVMDGGDEVRK